jgi:hypothetical protein
MVVEVWMAPLLKNEKRMLLPFSALRMKKNIQPMMPNKGNTKLDPLDAIIPSICHKQLAPLFQLEEAKTLQATKVRMNWFKSSWWRCFSERQIKQKSKSATKGTVRKELMSWKLCGRAKSDNAGIKLKWKRRN